VFASSKRQTQILRGIGVSTTCGSGWVNYAYRLFADS